MSRRRLAVAACAVVLLASACSDNHKVGTSVDTSKRIGGNLSLGQDTTTASTQPVFTLPATRTTLRAAPTTVAASRTHSSTPTTAVQSFQIIAINSDDSSNTQFDPSALSVYTGTPVHWQNHDAKPRSVVEDDGTFRSPLIPPGGEWVYVPQAPGTFNYQDGTRPYAVGSLTVVSQ